jgi:hypothetical protein
MRDETLALHAGFEADLDLTLAAAMRTRLSIAP